MPKLKRVDLPDGVTAFKFWCPGCQEAHAVKVAPDGSGWAFNGDLENPTFSPSVLTTTGHYAPGHQGPCWCDYNEAHPNEPAPFTCKRCHLFLRDGVLEYLGDCTHKMAWRRVELPDFPVPERQTPRVPRSPYP